jgi:predicted RNA binding protein YcfA (HicA-like mRNA interferase family)
VKVLGAFSPGAFSCLCQTQIPIWLEKPKNREACFFSLMSTKTSPTSHRHFKHPDQASVITVPGNDGKELAPGTLNAILKKAELK